MAMESNGAGQFTEVTLRPKVKIADAGMLDKARELHTEAHKMCFIARSVNFPVKHQPLVSA
jgi:organic hydroperoxide reductase OsmC/OhrA